MALVDEIDVNSASLAIGEAQDRPQNESPEKYMALCHFRAADFAAPDDDALDEDDKSDGGFSRSSRRRSR